MFEFIRGKLIESTSDTAIIETSGGIGYRLLIPPHSPDHFPAQGTELLFYTSFVVREQSQTLYGFIDSKQRDLFELLIAISGVGPKIALALIGHTTISELHKSIQRDDTAPLCRVPGIGKKSASRILVEMRDKLPQLFTAHTPSDDAVSALIHLGYSRNAAVDAVEKALKRGKGKEIELSSLITEALKK